jgi:hypothetical protein
MAVACLFVLASLAGFLHQTVVDHEVCAEHGELVHARGETPTGADDDEHAEHEHCELGPVRHDQTCSLQAAAFVLGANDGGEFEAPLDQGTGALPVTLDHRLAPKNSPPTPS